MWCPNCGAEYVAGVWACSDCHVTLVAEEPAAPESREPAPLDPRLAAVRTAFLGRFNPLVVPILLEMLDGEEIFATTKAPPDEPNYTPYGLLDDNLHEVLVDASKVQEARRLVDERLPEILEALSSEVDAVFEEEAE